jgi:hypothetical protein
MAGDKIDNHITPKIDIKYQVKSVPILRINIFHHTNPDRGKYSCQNQHKNQRYVPYLLEPISWFKGEQTLYLLVLLLI